MRKKFWMICLPLLLIPIGFAGREQETDSGQAEAVLPVVKTEADALSAMPDARYPSACLSDGFGTEYTQISTQPPAPVPTPVRRVDSGEKPYPVQWDTSGGVVQRTKFGYYSGEYFFDLDTAGQVKNVTEWSNAALLEESRKPFSFSIEGNLIPEVLIVHTHTTESYEPCVREGFDTSFNYRTTDPNCNMIMVGDAITAQLKQAGIGVVHSTEIHDYPSYTGSYERSRVTIQKVLDEFPSIKIVLDIHRDAIGTDEVIQQPVVEIDGRESAQVMIISGCDDGTMEMPDYLENFRFACAFQQQMEQSYPGLTRPVLFDYRHYNQDMTTGSLLIEVGTHGNTLDQAEYAGELIGASLAQLLTQKKEGEE